MELVVTRKEFGAISTGGELSIDGRFFCYTLEDKVRPDGEKVEGETAIPYGVYSVVVDFSPHFGRDLPRLLNVPNFDGVRIHPGNTPADTEGCILVGNEKGDGWIGKSRDAFNNLFSLLEAAVKKPEQISLKIVEG